MLQNKNAIIYGAGGSLGSAVAKAFADAGAKLFLSGKTLSSIQKAVHEISYSGEDIETAEVDALDWREVDEYINAVAKKAGTIDIVYNAIGWQDMQDIPLVEMKPEDFLRPITIAMQSQFITSSTAGKIMMKQRSGVILSLTATPGGIGYPNVGGFGPACCAVEAFTRNLASELGPYGVRVVNMRSAGSPDSRVFREAIEHGGEEIRNVIRRLEGDTMLKQLPLMEDIANTAVFLASSMASKITGVTIDVTCGTTAALNHTVGTIPFGKER